MHDEHARFDLDALRTRVADDPGAPEFPALAEALRRAGDATSARDVAEAGLDSAPSRLAGRVALALARMDLGEPEQGRAQLERVLDEMLEPYRIETEPEAPLAPVDARTDSSDTFEVVADAEIDAAFDEAEAQPDEMHSPNRMAESILDAEAPFEVDAEIDADPLLEEGAGLDAEAVFAADAALEANAPLEVEAPLDAEASSETRAQSAAEPSLFDPDVSLDGDSTLSDASALVTDGPLGDTSAFDSVADHGAAARAETGSSAHRSEFDAPDESAAVEVDAAPGPDAEPGEYDLTASGAFATHTMAGLLEQQGDHAGANSIRTALDDETLEPEGLAPGLAAGAPFEDATPMDAAEQMPAPASATTEDELDAAQRARVLATLERWLHNLQRGVA